MFNRGLMSTRGVGVVGTLQTCYLAGSGVSNWLAGSCTAVIMSLCHSLGHNPFAEGRLCGVLRKFP